MISAVYWIFYRAFLDPQFYKTFALSFFVGVYVLWLAWLLDLTLFTGTCPARRPALPINRVQVTLTAEQSLRARARWQQASKRVRKILRQRRIYFELGRYLQDPAIQDLVLGLEKVRGKLVRSANTAVARQARESAVAAQAKARLRASFAR